MSRTIPLPDASCQVAQAQAILSLWLEANTVQQGDVELIGAILTLLDGVAEAIDRAECELADMQRGRP